MSDDERREDEVPEAPESTSAVPHPAAAQPAEVAPEDEARAEVEGDEDDHEDAVDVELDAVGEATPEDAVAAQLRDALGQLRSEADRIGSLGTGQEQVEAAEQFAEDAGRLDEQLGAAARAADADGNG